MTSRQWSEWIAYYRVEPFGHDIALNLLANVCAILANAYRKKGAKQISANDFYKTVKLASKKQSMEDMKSVLMALVDSGGNKPKGKKATKKGKDK